MRRWAGDMALKLQDIAGNKDENKEIPAKKAIENIVAEYKSGKISKEEAIETITSIGLLPEVTMYFIGQLPDVSEVEKESIWRKIVGFFK
jgi:hypothetical protein